MENTNITNTTGFTLDYSFENDTKVYCEKHFSANSTDVAAILRELDNLNADGIAAVYKEVVATSAIAEYSNIDSE